MPRTIARPGYAGDVAEHILKFQVHLGEGLLHAINAGGGVFGQGLTGLDVGLAPAHNSRTVSSMSCRGSARVNCSEGLFKGYHDHNVRGIYDGNYRVVLTESFMLIRNLDVRRGVARIKAIGRD